MAFVLITAAREVSSVLLLRCTLQLKAMSALLVIT